MAKTGFSLKNDMLKPSDPMQQYKGSTEYNLPLDKLVPFEKHPFRLYEGQQLEELVESIRTNGIIVPIITRPAPNDDTRYEILSGHNRVAAARILEFREIPVIVREGLTEEEAKLIVTETNLLTRQLTNLSHSELAAIIAERHGAIKQQGKRADLISEIESMVKSGNNRYCETSGNERKKLDSRADVGAGFDLSGRSIANYLRINKLVEPLKGQLDKGKFGIIAGVMLSHIPESEQITIANVLDSSKYKIDGDKAETLRLVSKKKPLDRKAVEDILSGMKESENTRLAAFKLKEKIIDKYFKPGQKQDEIEAIITAALDYYYAHQAQEGVYENGK